LKRSVLGQQHPDTLQEGRKLAVCLNLLGSFDEGQKLLEETIETMRSVLGPEHHDTLQTQFDLACIICQRGETARSKELALKTLDVMRRACGEEHPDTLNMKFGITPSFGDSGDDGAHKRKLLEEVLAAYRRIYGPTHSRTLATLYPYISSVSNSGDYDRALALNDEIYQTLCRDLGPNAPKTLDASWHGVRLLLKQGKVEECKELASGLLETARAQDPQDASTLQTLKNQVDVLVNLGDHEAALPIYREAVDVSRRVHGPQSLETGILMFDLGGCNLELCNYKDAEQAYYAALELLRRAVGEENHYTLVAMHNLALAIEGQGRLDEARKPLEKVIEIDRRVYSPEHPNTRLAEGALRRSLEDGGGHRLAQLKKFPEAAKIYQSLLSSSRMTTAWRSGLRFYH
jgi:tetratricopeptide (TPR) repeat protein